MATYKMSKKTVSEKLPSLIKKYGARKAARTIVNAQVFAVSGMGLDSLPDTAEICNMVDEIEGIIESEISSNVIDEVLEILSQIDTNFVEELVFS